MEIGNHMLYFSASDWFCYICGNSDDRVRSATKWSYFLCSEFDDNFKFIPDWLFFSSLEPLSSEYFNNRVDLFSFICSVLDKTSKFTPDLLFFVCTELDENFKIFPDWLFLLSEENNSNVDYVSEKRLSSDKNFLNIDNVSDKRLSEEDNSNVVNVSERLLSEEYVSHSNYEPYSHSFGIEEYYSNIDYVSDNLLFDEYNLLFDEYNLLYDADHLLYEENYETDFFFYIGMFIDGYITCIKDASNDMLTENESILKEYLTNLNNFPNNRSPDGIDVLLEFMYPVDYNSYISENIEYYNEKNNPKLKTETIDITLENVGIECAICLTDYDLGEKVNILPCNHVFHISCINRWLCIRSTCPVCRMYYQNPDSPSIDIYPNLLIESFIDAYYTS